MLQIVKYFSTIVNSAQTDLAPKQVKNNWHVDSTKVWHEHMIWSFDSFGYFT